MIAVERQTAHVWGGSMASSSMLFALESIMDRPVLEFSPVLAVIAAMVFLVKSGTLSGTFYVPALILFATSPPRHLATDGRIAEERSARSEYLIVRFGVCGDVFSVRIEVLQTEDRALETAVLCSNLSFPAEHRTLEIASAISLSASELLTTKFSGRRFLR